MGVDVLRVDYLGVNVMVLKSSDKIVNTPMQMY